MDWLTNLILSINQQSLDTHMTDNKSLYLTLKEENLIQSETFIKPPTRSREKAMGFMWEGGMEVLLKNGLKVIFQMWHHCHDDDGESWYPSQTMLDSFWTTQFVPSERSASSNLVDACWHSFKVGSHFYISKTGTFSNVRDRNSIIQSVQDDTWGYDSDLWRLI